MKRGLWLVAVAAGALVLGGAAAAIFLPSDRLFDFQTGLRQTRPATGEELAEGGRLVKPEPLRDSRAYDVPDIKVDVLIDPHGRVANARLANTEPDVPADLGRAAIHRAMAFRYRPFTDRSGRAVWVRNTEWLSVRLPEIRPKRHIPFPSWAGKTVAITLERTGCFGSCAAYVVIIHDDGAVDYCGRAFVKATGWRHSRITPAHVEALLREFRDADFFSLNDSYIAPITDHPSRFVGIEIGDQGKTVHDYIGEEAGMPASVTRLEDAIDAAANTAQWVGPREGFEVMSYADAADCSVPKA